MASSYVMVGNGAARTPSSAGQECCRRPSTRDRTPAWSTKDISIYRLILFPVLPSRYLGELRLPGRFGAFITVAPSHLEVPDSDEEETLLTHWTDLQFTCAQACTHLSTPTWSTPTCLHPPGLHPPVYTSHHEQLFELLWALGQRVEPARLSGRNHKLFGSLKHRRTSQREQARVLHRPKRTTLHYCMF
ncbi:hypothetical protein EYF80_038462 [Liparis tanakae]|uniref:Uncharacterized protein n=1 Tax=Liparis tanakae TaxID=230148 RepID=A0A4Z2GF84_9TELE|nr:hypothetical protein EYF80_038462 [Liparis tanakae]